MSSRIHCWLHGHEWGAWEIWETFFGDPVKARWCKQCRARQVDW